MSSASAVRAGQAYVELITRQQKFDQGLKTALSKLQSFASKATELSKINVVASFAYAYPVMNAIKDFAAFDDKMRIVQATTKATGQEFQELTNLARDLGRTTSFTAQQAAAGMVALSRSGFETDQIKTLIGHFLDLSRATAVELPSAIETASAVLRGFQLEASDAGEVADVLTVAANRSAQTLNDLGDAYKYVSPLARETGMTLKDSAKVLAFLANMGIKGTQAATSMRNILIRMSTKDVQLKYKELGVDVIDRDTGALRRLSDVMLDLSKAVEKLPKGNRLEIFRELFGLYGLAGGASLAGGQNIDKMFKEIDEADGKARDIAQQMDEGIGGKMRLAWSEIKDAVLESVDVVTPSLEEILASVTEFTTQIKDYFNTHKQALNDFIRMMAEVFKQAAKIASTFGRLAVYFSPLILAFQNIKLHILALAVTFKKAIGVFSVFKGAIDTTTSVILKMDEVVLRMFKQPTFKDIEEEAKAAIDAYEKATQDVVKAEDKYQKALGNTKAKDKLTAATSRQNAADSQFEFAADNYQKALIRRNTALNENRAYIQEVTEAETEFKNAQLESKEASKQVAEAKAKEKQALNEAAKAEKDYNALLEKNRQIILQNAKATQDYHDKEVEAARKKKDKAAVAASNAEKKYNDLVEKNNLAVLNATKQAQDAHAKAIKDAEEKKIALAKKAAEEQSKYDLIVTRNTEQLQARQAKAVQDALAKKEKAFADYNNQMKVYRNAVDKYGENSFETNKQGAIATGKWNTYLKLEEEYFKVRDAGLDSFGKTATQIKQEEAALERLNAAKAEAKKAEADYKKIKKQNVEAVSKTAEMEKKEQVLLDEMNTKKKAASDAETEYNDIKKRHVVVLGKDQKMIEEEARLLADLQDKQKAAQEASDNLNKAIDVETTAKTNLNAAQSKYQAAVASGTPTTIKQAEADLKSAEAALNKASADKVAARDAKLKAQAEFQASEAAIVEAQAERDAALVTQKAAEHKRRMALASYQANAGLIRLTKTLSTVIVGFTAFAMLASVMAGGLQMEERAVRQHTEAVARETQTMEKRHEQENKALQTLKDYAKKQSLNNNEIKEAQRLIALLTGKYGDLGLKIDSTTGKIEGLTEAQQKMMEKQTQGMIRQKRAQMQALKSDIEYQKRLYAMIAGEKFDNFWDKVKATGAKAQDLFSWTGLTESSAEKLERIFNDIQAKMVELGLLENDLNELEGTHKNQVDGLAGSYGQLAILAKEAADEKAKLMFGDNEEKEYYGRTYEDYVKEMESALRNDMFESIMPKKGISNEFKDAFEFVANTGTLEDMGKWLAKWLGIDFQKQYEDTMSKIERAKLWFESQERKIKQTETTASIQKELVDANQRLADAVLSSNPEEIANAQQALKDANDRLAQATLDAAKENAEAAKQAYELAKQELDNANIAKENGNDSGVMAAQTNFMTATTNLQQANSELATAIEQAGENILNASDRITSVGTFDNLEALDLGGSQNALLEENRQQKKILEKIKDSANRFFSNYFYEGGEMV